MLILNPNNKIQQRLPVTALSIVAVTAFVNDESIRRCFEVGMQHVIHKPVGIEGIRAVLEQYFYNNTSKYEEEEEDERKRPITVSPSE